MIGRVRNTPNWSGDDVDVLSLGLFPGSYLQFTHDDRYVNTIVLEILLFVLQDILPIRSRMGQFTSQFTTA